MTDRKPPDMRRSTNAERAAVKKAPALGSILAALKVLASLDTEMQIQTVSMLVIVAQRPGVYQRDMDALVGVSQSSVSRNVHNLSRYRPDGSPGLGLIEQRPDPHDVRSQRLYLTAAGVAFIRLLVERDDQPTPAKPLPMALPDAFAGRHWEVWVD